MPVPISTGVFRLIFPNTSLIPSHTKGSNQNPSDSQREIRASILEAFSHLTSACVVCGRKMLVVDTAQSLPSFSESESASQVLQILSQNGRMVLWLSMRTVSQKSLFIGKKNCSFHLLVDLSYRPKQVATRKFKLSAF